MAPHAVLLMPLRGHLGHEMHLFGLIASPYKSIPSHLFLNAGSFWIVHECDLYVEAKDGFRIFVIIKLVF